MSEMCFAFKELSVWFRKRAMQTVQPSKNRSKCGFLKQVGSY